MSEHVAVVTGGSGALGSAVVQSLLDEGWTVHVPGTTPSRLEALREGTSRHPGLHTAEADLNAPEAVRNFFQAVLERSGRLDLLCNLVGGFAMGPLGETDPETWHRLMDTNAGAPFLATRAAADALADSGRGAVVNVAAAAALDGPASGMAAYLASKAAVVSLTENLAKELAPRGITVNAVAPTIIDTPANRRAMPDAQRGDWLSPQEIAGVIRFLAGPQARIVTGTVVRLSRGGA